MTFSGFPDFQAERPPRHKKMAEGGSILVDSRIKLLKLKIL